MERIKIVHNKIQCKKCGEILESVHVHDFVPCSCFKETDGKEGCAVDGGKSYLRRLAQSLDDFVDLSETRPYTKEELKEMERQYKAKQKYEDEYWIKLIESLRKKEKK